MNMFFSTQHPCPVCWRRGWFWGDNLHWTHCFQKYMIFLIDICDIDDYDWYLQVMFFTVFFAFAQLGYLLFGTQVIIAATQRRSYIFHLSVCLFDILQRFLCWYEILYKGGGLQQFLERHLHSPPYDPWRLQLQWNWTGIPLFLWLIRYLLSF